MLPAAVKARKRPLEHSGNAKKIADRWQLAKNWILCPKHGEAAEAEAEP